jgi:hypothetical protein
VNPTPKTTTPHGNNMPDAGDLTAIHSLLATTPMTQDDLTIEAITVRANYVGPVLEDILHEMETHGDDNLDTEY